MNLLLLSSGLGAIPDFLTEATGKSPEDSTIVYVNDAATLLGRLTAAPLEQQQLARMGYTVKHATLAKLTAAESAALFDSADAVFVMGGQTDVLLQALRTTGADRVLTSRVAAGFPYIGASAGAIVAGRDIRPGLLLDGPTHGCEVESTAGLGLADVLVLPHTNAPLLYSQQTIDDARAALDGEPGLYLLQDDQALRIVDGETAVIPSP